MKILSIAFYIFSTISMASWIIYKTWKWARKIRKGKRKNIAKHFNYEAVKTESPLEHPDKVAQKRAYESVEKQFSITKKTLFPLIIITAVIVLVLPFLENMPASLLSLFVTIVTVVLGIAARPFVENVIAGMVISSSKVLKIGDTVQIGESYGTVEDITLTYFTVKTWDWKRYITPNSKMLNSDIINYNHIDSYVWAHIEFWVSYQEDINLVENLSIWAAKESQYFANYEAPKFWIMEMDKDSYCCWVAAWADNPSKAWMLKNDMRTQLIKSFQKYNIATFKVNINIGEMKEKKVNKKRPINFKEV